MNAEGEAEERGGAIRPFRFVTDRPSPSLAAFPCVCVFACCGDRWTNGAGPADGHMITSLVAGTARDSERERENVCGRGRWTVHPQKSRSRRENWSIRCFSSFACCSLPTIRHHYDNFVSSYRAQSTEYSMAVWQYSTPSSKKTKTIPLRASDPRTPLSLPSIRSSSQNR